ncbi:hypothetical protein EDD15DRAFT_73217 [Pisolithus albus]|nr:hypothetical protein EDD15DRAFT_73217 [Pisolithus albus]
MASTESRQSLRTLSACSCQVTSDGRTTSSLITWKRLQLSFPWRRRNWIPHHFVGLGGQRGSITKIRQIGNLDAGCVLKQHDADASSWSPCNDTVRRKFRDKKGIVHSDIKPENFLLALDDPSTIKLINFGISKPFACDKSTAPKKYDPLKERRHIIGTLYWASLNSNSHNGEERFHCYMVTRSGGGYMVVS